MLWTSCSRPAPANRSAPASRPVPSTSGRPLRQMREGVEVAGRLAALRPPGVLLADRAREAQLQQRVEGAVRRLQDRPQQPVELRGGDDRERQPADEIDVAELVDGVTHPEE